MQIERHGLPLTPESLATLPPFASISFNTDDANGGNCKPEVAKTGLGSSAAMTTAVVAALLHYLGVVKISSSKDRQERKDIADLDMVHKIAQTAHCIAQGKVGSGFDVSSAVYGSHRYVRFSPEVISSTQVLCNNTAILIIQVHHINTHTHTHDRICKFNIELVLCILPCLYDLYLASISRLLTAITFEFFKFPGQICN